MTGETRKRELEARLKQLNSEVHRVKEELDTIRATEKWAEWADLSTNYEIDLYKGRAFHVTQPLADYAEMKGWTRGTDWKPGQIARITDCHDTRIRAECFINHRAPCESGGHLFGYYNVYTPTTPFPADLIAEACKIAPAPIAPPSFEPLRKDNGA